MDEMDDRDLMDDMDGAQAASMSIYVPMPSLLSISSFLRNRRKPSKVE